MSSGLNKELREKHAVSVELAVGNWSFGRVEVRVGSLGPLRDRTEERRMCGPDATKTSTCRKIKANNK